MVIEGASPKPRISYATLEHIADALTELLPKRTRYAFEMYRLHGVPQKDIAKELGVSPTLVQLHDPRRPGALPQGHRRAPETIRT